MPSIVPGYEYDIFISYRQKDNKGDRWVSEFVEALKTELESTFKEEISVYFDINPHDGLLETHDVNASLKDKLKCLVFIPIISRTYCDPKSFAWEHEFNAFVDKASTDQFGLKVKLPNGNVARRVLPVLIHDLDNNDIKLFESILGGILRGIEFIYKESGFNRPLKPDDDEKINLNKIKYRNQISKVALAIKDIILSLKTEPPPLVNENTRYREPLKEGKIVERRKDQREHFLLTKHKLLTSAIIIVVLIVIVLIYSKVLPTGKTKVTRDSNGKISIAVNTFENLTGDTTLNYWGLGIQELLINNLGNSTELSVQNTRTMYELYESMRQSKNASIIPLLSKEAALKLKAGAYITGNYQKTSNKIIILVKLINTKNDEVLWTSKIGGSLYSNYADLADSLSAQVKSFLEIKSLKQNTSLDFSEAFTNSSDAYRKYIEGMNYFMKGNYLSAIKSYEEAFNIDSTFTLAAFFIAFANNTIGEDENNSQAAKWIQKAYRGKERLPQNYQLWLETWHAIYFTKNSNEILAYLNALENSDIKSRYYWFDIGSTYASSEIYDKSIKAFEKIETISSEWGEDWKVLYYYYFFGLAYHYTGDHKKEAKISETGLKLFPDNPYLILNQIRCAISQGDSAKTSGLEKELIAVSKKSGASEKSIESALGTIYMEAKSFDKAEEHYRIALKLDSSDSYLLNNFASFLIKTDKNVVEGMQLIDKALKLNPGNWFFLDSKGWGLYKQGKLKEADSILNMAKDNCPGWSYPLNRQIQEVKKALASQK